MTIKEELAAELRDALKTKDGPRRDVIRQIETEVSLARSAPGFGGVVDDALYRQVIASYTKKMEKARAEYVGFGEQGRAMADKLAFEVSYLQRWLPRKLGETETREMVRATIADLDVAGDQKSAGRVIGTLMKTHGGDLDGALVSRIVAEELG
ncbi:MAG: GatB/YqeY domain-containing protein [Actinobacteria bacterium]|nr:GatB/YqeY domain-containing protein [Actinomycetota bacterium]MCI0679572.1 GatB/YqeY domain-containing protein [Actinomycetota bacterium]